MGKRNEDLFQSVNNDNTKLERQAEVIKAQTIHWSRCSCFTTKEVRHKDIKEIWASHTVGPVYFEVPWTFLKCWWGKASHRPCSWVWEAWLSQDLKKWQPCQSIDCIRFCLTSWSVSRFLWALLSHLNKVKACENQCWTLSSPKTYLRENNVSQIMPMVILNQ